MADRDYRKVMRAFGLASTLGFNFAASVLIGFYLGRYLDNKLGTDPWLLILGLLIGIAAGMWGTYQMVTTFWKEK